jgi:NitT/TauT family transport system substrate-binding protein
MSRAGLRFVSGGHTVIASSRLTVRGHGQGPRCHVRAGVAGVAATLMAATLMACAGSVATPAAPSPAALSPAALSPAAGGSGSSPSSSAGSPGALTRLTVGLGYIPSVQFAQFYFAQQAGYYRDAGLEVTFENKIDPDLVVLVAQGAVDIGLADGTSVIPAVSQGIPIRYVTTVYATFPNVVFTRSDSGIRTAADLRGKRVGTPGRYGSNWIHLEALLASAGMTADDIQVVPFPDFGQAAGLAKGTVDAATGYVNNDPIQLSRQGIPVTIVQGQGMIDLPGPGLVAGTATLATKDTALRAFASATLRAMKEIAADPGKGLDAAIAAVPELAQDRAQQLAILDATITAWRSAFTDTHGLGAIDTSSWAQSIAFIEKLPEKLVAAPVTVDQLVVAGFPGT